MLRPFGSYTLMNTQVKTPILHHKDAVIDVTWAE